jgi:hypothetical protein
MWMQLWQAVVSGQDPAVHPDTGKTSNVTCVIVKASLVPTHLFTAVHKDACLLAVTMQVTEQADLQALAAAPGGGGGGVRA